MVNFAKNHNQPDKPQQSVQHTGKFAYMYHQCSFSFSLSCFSVSLSLFPLRSLSPSRSRARSHTADDVVRASMVIYRRSGVLIENTIQQQYMDPIDFVRISYLSRLEQLTSFVDYLSLNVPSFFRIFSFFSRVFGCDRYCTYTDPCAKHSIEFVVRN